MATSLREYVRWTQRPVRWGRRLLERGPDYLPYVLTVLIAFALTPFVWILLLESFSGRRLPALPSGHKNTLHSAVAILDRYDPFGSPPPSLAHGTETGGVIASNLAFKLVGVAVLPEPRLSLAILQTGNVERVYRVGERLPGGARIVAVHPDSVVVRYQGVLQAFSFTHKNLGAFQPTPSYPARAGSPSLAENLLAHPSNLMNYLRPIPVYTGGRFSGIRLYPGPNASLFERVGLRPGDVLTAVNGVTLTNPLQGYNLIQRFAAQHVPIILNIERNGTSLVISLPSSSVL
jgi:general secretion pathway protein C